MNKAVLCGVVLVMLLICSTGVFASEMSTDGFSFVSMKDERLDGLISRPGEGEAESIVIIVHGYGPTNVVAGDHYRNFRSKFTEKGMSVVVWDKPGNGKSEGEFDINQPIVSSAEEILSAIKALRQSNEPGSDRIGLWGVSRAGWIAPVAIQRDPSIRFWVSVSGTDAYENWGYFLRSNLEIAGYASDDIDTIYNAWVDKNRLFWTGGDYESYLMVSKPFWQDEYVQKLTGKPYVEHKPGSPGYEEDLKLYEEYRQKWLSEGNTFDEESGLQISVPEFDQVLESISIPVLAIFGDNDKNVDWRKTKALYEKTIGQQDNSDLTIKVFEGADHNLKMSKTGGYLEMQQQEEYWSNPTASGFYDVMMTWVCDQGFCSSAL